MNVNSKQDLQAIAISSGTPRWVAMRLVFTMSPSAIFAYV